MKDLFNTFSPKPHYFCFVSGEIESIQEQPVVNRRINTPGSETAVFGSELQPPELYSEPFHTE